MIFNEVLQKGKLDLFKYMASCLVGNKSLSSSIITDFTIAYASLYITGHGSVKETTTPLLLNDRE